MSANRKYARFCVGVVTAVVLSNTAAPVAADVPDLLVTSFTNEILRYDGDTGDFVGVFADGGGLSYPEDITWGLDGNLLVVSHFTDQVLRYDGQTGGFIDVFAGGPSGPGSLRRPSAMTIGPDANLYATGSLSGPAESRIQRYDGQTGAFIDTFILGSNQTRFIDLAFGPDGDLYALRGTEAGLLYHYDGLTGDFIETFSIFARSITSGPDDLLYLGGGSGVTRFDPLTGQDLGLFASGGGLDRATGVAFGQGGDLYVSSFGTSEILRYDGETGNFIGTFAGGGSLAFPTALLFIPEPTSILLILLSAAIMLARRERNERRPIAKLHRNAPGVSD